jgi:hypothetical protein
LVIGENKKRGYLMDEGHDLDVHEEYDKPHKGYGKERVSKELQEFPLVISWLGTWVDRLLRVNSSKPIIGWKGEHQQSVGW